MKIQQITHKGWFGVCPVYFGGLDTEAPLVVERHWSLLPLMVVSEYVYQLCFYVQGLIDPAFEPAWPLKITGEVTK